jgi:RNA polymerase sigma-54 factor
MSNAQWLIDAVQQRRRTILRVVEAVVANQREFFDYGPQALKPLPMTQVAEELGIHVATVSRAVAEKHVATPRGIWPLRKFFSGGVQTKNEEGQGEEMAWDAIKVALREVIDAEDKSKPLSDEALVDELKKRGIEIARRTVAKYRDQLQIPPKRLRKTF